jgi:hypothetical protein
MLLIDTYHYRYSETSLNIDTYRFMYIYTIDVSRGIDISIAPFL